MSLRNVLSLLAALLLLAGVPGCSREPDNRIKPGVSVTPRKLTEEEKKAKAGVEQEVLK